MPLSRLDNFLKNVKGNILYVDPNNLDATDGIENQGNSAARPFSTLQRALIEASRFSYQKGVDNDRFEKTTICLAPGDHHIDNRPGWIPTGISGSEYLLRSGINSNDFAPLNNTSNFDIFDTNNILYKLNSIHGGVVIPRGTSIVGQDLRKTVIRPLYVPNPENELIERSAIFRVTGGCYLNSFTTKDADPNKPAYKDYTNTNFDPTFSHHRLTIFEYADGTNSVNIQDDFVSYATHRTDLDMYYEKVGIAYGPASGREVEPDYPSPKVDIQPRIDEFRIVGPDQGSAGINSIKAGDGTTPTNVIDVQLTTPIFGLNVDTNVIINNVSDTRYNGTYLVTDVTQSIVNAGVTGFKYVVPVTPGDPLPNPVGTNVELSTDTVTSASPYIFNCSIRSIYGICGMHADGAKADGFKSMVVAQFTGVSLQVDDNSFVVYNSQSGSFDDSVVVPNLHTNINAVYKPKYTNYHIKASNNSVIQLVSTFAIGYANQFVTESGGDFSVTNSNSNFGQIALVAKGFRSEAFDQDDVGYLTQIIPPKTLNPASSTIEFSSLDIAKTTSVGDTARLYLYNEISQNDPPNTTIQGYRFGASNDELINTIIPVGGIPTNFRARVVMEDTEYATKKVSGRKVSRVGRNVSTGNSITGNTIMFTEPHQLLQGESIRVISNDGRLPDGFDTNTLYFSIVDGLPGNQIQVAQSFNDSLSGNKITINNLGDTLFVESRVSDKDPGDIGHPVQYDTSQSQWYVNVSSASTENNLYAKLVSGGLGDASPRTFITRTQDSRMSEDRIHKMRFVIPKTVGTEAARPPIDGYVLQESSHVTGSNNTEVQLEFNPGSVTMSNDAQMRNFSFIADVDYKSGIAFYTTELPHGLSIGSSVTVKNVTSTVNTTYTATTGTTYNPNTGILQVVTTSSHNLANGDQVKILDSTIRFSCASDGYATQHDYPRSTDPVSNLFLVVSVVNLTTFNVNVGTSPDKSLHAFISAVANSIVGGQNSGYNGTFEVTGISSSKTFSVNQIYSNPGTFTNNTSQRTTALPTFQRTRFVKDYYAYNVETINEYKNGEQDGIYYMSLLNSDVAPTIAPFNTDEYQFSQPVQFLYPQLDRDNPVSTAPSADCYATPDNIGRTVINDPVNSLTGETLEEIYTDTGIGVGLTDIISNSVGTAYTVFTAYDHGLNRVTKAVIDNVGGGYGDGSNTIQYYYNAKLENLGSGSIGRNATALVTVDGTSSGEIIDIAIMDGGTAWAPGDTFSVVGIATTTGSTQATGTINKIFDNRGDIINISGINQFDGRKMNSEYRVTGISGITEVEVVPLTAENTSSRPGIATQGIGIAAASPGGFSVIGPSYTTSNFVYDKNSGIATVTTDYPNIFRVNNSVRIVGTAATFYNGSFACVDKIGLSTVVLNVGINTITPPLTGTIRIYSGGIQNNSGESVVGSGRLHGREQPIYAGITTTLSTAVTSKTTDSININNMTDYNFLIGDHIQVNDEIMRIKTTVSRVAGTTQVKVFRGVYGTIANTHVDGSVVTRITLYPMEFRRNSIIRASGHTFEYICYGPGNYSTALPLKQTKQLTLEEQINVQAQRMSGGVVNYTGMNDRGDFYIGNKRIASTTGKEQVFDTPVQTVQGEDPYTEGTSDDSTDFNYVDSSIVQVNRNLVVDGGGNGDILSEFNGPVQFTQKVVSTSEEGMEANSLFLQGDAQVSRKITVGTSIPTEAGTPGDIVYNANPTNGGSVGWVYTTSNVWKEFGTIAS